MRDANTVHNIRGRLASVPTWVWIALLPGYVIRLVVAWLPVEESFALSVPDDAYYYFKIASNIAAGYGVTFDGLAPTNGFHPLWMAMITPLWWIAGEVSSALPVHLALTLGALLDVLTVCGMWCLAAQLVQRRLIAGLIVLAYAWNPYNMAASVNGLETSVGMMLFVWSLVAYWRMRSEARLNWKSWLWIGVLWSVLTLARTDYVVLILPCFVELAWRHRRSLRGAWAMGIGVLLWIPWLAWNLATFGSIAQVSGKVYPYYHHAIWQSAAHTFGEWLVREASMAFKTFFGVALLSGFSYGLVILGLGAVALVGMALCSRRFGDEWGSEAAFHLWGLIWPTVGAIGLLLIHGLVRWMLVHWYFVPASILLVLWFGVVLTWLDRRDPSWPVALGMVYLGFQLLHGATLWHQGGMWAEQRRSAEEFMREGVKLCERFNTIAVSDSGYFAYHLPCRVVNADGVANNQAFAAIVEGRFREYLDEAGVEYAALNDIVRRVVEAREGPVPETAPFAASKTENALESDAISTREETGP